MLEWETTSLDGGEMDTTLIGGWYNEAHSSNSREVYGGEHVEITY
jgi:hypothetical protein